MSSVVGHALAGALCAKGIQPSVAPGRDKWLVSTAVAVAVLPDADVLIYALLQPEGMQPHRGFSHSLLFAVASGSIAYLLTCRYFAPGGRRLFATLVLAAVTQPLLDVLMGAGPRISLFAPFYDGGFLLPFRAVPTAYYATTGTGLLSLARHTPTLIGIGLEVMLLAPLILLCQRPRGRRAAVLVLTSVAAECAILLIYNSR